MTPSLCLLLAWAEPFEMIWLCLPLLGPPPSRRTHINVKLPHSQLCAHTVTVWTFRIIIYMEK